MNSFFTYNPLWHEKTGTFIDFMIDIIEKSLYQYIDGAKESPVAGDDPVKFSNDPVN
jgi:hypothetical protein